MAIVMRPRMNGKTYTQQSSRNFKVVSHSRTFPRKCGFQSLAELIKEVTFINDGINNKVINDYIMSIASYINHLGDINKDYLYVNITEYAYLYMYCIEVHKDHPEKAATRALDMLVSVNIYRERYNKPHNLPKVLSRKYLHIKQLLNEYLDNEITHIQIGVLDEQADCGL